MKYSLLNKRSKKYLKSISIIAALSTTGFVFLCLYNPSNNISINANINDYFTSNNTSIKSTTFNLSSEFDNKYNAIDEKKVYINSNAVPVKSEPNDESETIGILDYSNYVYVVGEDIQQSFGWTKILIDDQYGYINTQYISDEMLFLEYSRTLFVNSSSYLRSSPSLESDENIVRELQLNDKLEQIAYNSEWIKIKGEEQDYYLEAKYFSQNMIFFEDERNIYTHDNSIPIYYSPYDKSTICFYLDKGEELVQLASNNNWAQIKYNNNLYYVELVNTSKYKPVVANNKTSESRTIFCNPDVIPVIEYAYKLLYTADYQYGSATPELTDCSGLTLQCYKQIGIKLGRSAADQAYDGKPIDFEDLEPGDVICFCPKGGGRISHAGLYVGDGLMVHAANSRDGLQETSLANYMKYGGDIVTIRRIIE